MLCAAKDSEPREAGGGEEGKSQPTSSNGACSLPEGPNGSSAGAREPCNAPSACCWSERVPRSVAAGHGARARCSAPGTAWALRAKICAVDWAYCQSILAARGREQAGAVPDPLAFSTSLDSAAHDTLISACPRLRPATTAW